MNLLDNNDNCEFSKYFKQLGYSYSWDFSKKLGEQWHELYDENEELVVQIDMKATLNQFINDSCVIEEISTDYWIAAENDNLCQILIDKIRTKEGKCWNTRKERDIELNNKL